MSEYFIRTARELKIGGILAKHVPKKGKTIPQERPQSINCSVRARPNLEIKIPTFLGLKNEILTTADV